MKILLVQPAPFEPGRLGLENVIWLSEPVALTSIAAMVPDHEVRILDMRLEEDLVYNEVLREFRPDLVGTTSMTTDCYQAKALLHIAKNTLGDDCFTLVGGHHPTLAPSDFYEDCVDAMCVGEGEETFAELVDHLDGGGSARDLAHIPGLRYQEASGEWVYSGNRGQQRELDTFPVPARHLVKRYSSEYFFTVANPMASMATSRGCSFDCNFCAIWEFYERRTRYLSAEAICDQLEQIEEPFVFFLDDNFLSKKARLEALAAEITRRGIKKYWGTQGRTDFIADNPDTMRRLRDAGLIMILSGYESNDENALDALLKRNTVDKNRRAAEMMRDLGIISTGIFMIRPEFDEADFDTLYGHINDLGVAMPLVTVYTPLPGTQLYREREADLLTRDSRLYDLLHSVLPTKLPRQRFYEKLAEYNQAVWPSFEKGTWAAIRKRPGFFWKARRGALRFIKKANNYRAIVEDAQSHLRDEIGIIAPEVVATEPLAKPFPVLDKTA